jgi:tetratricopeptide (TPR) repeat protein
MDRVNKIITLLEDGHHDEALRGFNEILVEGSNEERFMLGEELVQLGFLDEAKALFEKLLQVYPEEGELLVLLAETLIELGHEEEAILELEKVNHLDQSYPESLLLLADLYQMEGLYEVSEQKLLKAKTLLPNEVVIDFALGELYFEQGKFLEAISAYNKVLVKEHEVAGVNVNQRMADSISAGGAFEDALPYYEKAMEEKIEINTLFNYAFTALQAGLNRTAIEKFIELKELDPEYHSLYLYLARAYEREEELDNAFHSLKEGIKQDQFNKELYFYAGKIALKTAQEEEAERMFREALALDPEYTEAAFTLNKLLIKQERYEDVIEIITLLEKENVEEPRLYWDAAIAYQEIEEYSQALKQYESAYTFYKDTTEFLIDYGYFLIEEGKKSKAVEVFNKLILMDPSNEEYQDVYQRLTEDIH